jgi:hypothetical protein
MKMEAASDSSQTERNCTLLITSYFPNYIYENRTIYISQQQPEKRKNNEKKLLKDKISNLLSCGGYGCCYCGGFLVKKGRSSLLSMQKREVQTNPFEKLAQSIC